MDRLSERRRRRDDGYRFSPDDMLARELGDRRRFRDRCPEIYHALIDYAAFISWTRLQRGDLPVLALAYR